MSSTATQAMDWSDLLDALEERTRRLAVAIAGGGTAGHDSAGGDTAGGHTAGGDGKPVPEVTLLARGPIPRQLVHRAQALLLQTNLLEAEAVRRQAAMEVAMRYSEA